MKKLLLSALAALALTGAQAADDYYVIKDGSIQPNLEFYSWWNASFVQNQDGAAVFTAADKGADASCGILARDFATGPLNTATLHFTWRYSGETGASYAVRLTGGGVQEDYSFTPKVAGDWNSTSILVPSRFPTVAQNWKDSKNADGSGYVFSLILTGGLEDSVLEIKNVWYSDLDESWKAPAPLSEPTFVPVCETPEADVVSLLSKQYPQAVNYSFGDWGQSTNCQRIDIDGAPVLHMTGFNYQGLQFASNLDASKCNYLHIDYYTPTGSTLGFTPISPGPKERVYIVSDVVKDRWNSCDVPLSYYNNVDFSDLFQFKFDSGTGSDIYYIANLYFYYKEEQEIPDEPGKGEEYNGEVSGEASQLWEDVNHTYPYTIKYKIVYNEDNTLTINANYNWSEGKPVGLVVGSVLVNGVNYPFPDGSDMSDMTVSTTDTFTRGEILNMEFSAPYALGILNAPFHYTVGEEKEAETEPDDPVDPTTPAVYMGEISGVASPILGDVQTDYPYTLNYKITYNADKTLSIEADYQWTNGEPVGIVPGNVYINNEEHSFELVNGVRELAATKSTYNKGETLEIIFHIPMAGLALRNTIAYHVGETNVVDAVENVEIADTPAEYFTLSGVRVAEPVSGLYIRVQNGKATKIMIR